MEVIRVIHPCTHGNTIVRLLILAASWTELSRHLSLAYPEPCPSAQEGQTYALECTSKTQSHWKLSTLTEVCPQSGHLSCDWNKFGHVNVSRRQDGGKNISRLEFSTITHYFRNHTIQCVEEQTKTKEMSITECQMDIFLKPETVICEVLTLLHNHIRFTCQTSRIYPRLVCELRLRNEANNNTTNISPDIIYNDERLSSTEAVYYKSSCSVDILDLSPGTYSIYGVLTPAVKYTGYIGNMSFFIPKKHVVIYQPSPQVSVHLSGSVPTHICSDTPQTVIFNCHARMFQSRPHFKWLLLHLPVNLSQIDPNVEVYMNNETVYVSTCRINIEPFHVTIHVVCIANFSGHTAKDEFIKHLKRVQPVNPRFSVQSGEVISDSVLTIEGETQNISCQADTDDTVENKLNISCLKDGNFFLTSSLWGTRITISLIGKHELNGSTCTCTVIHSCYRVSSRITIKVIPSLSSTVNSDIAVTIEDDNDSTVTMRRNNSPEMKMFYLFFGITSLLVSIVVLAVVAILVTNRRRRR